MNSSYLNSENNTVLLLKPLKTIHLFLMVFLVFIIPVISFGQVDLVKWNAVNATNPLCFYPNYVSSNVTSQSITASAGVSLNYTSYNSVETFFQTGGWPTSQQNVGEYDPNKYIQFTIKPNTGYKSDLSSFIFNGRSDGSGKFRAKYSKDATFTTGVKDLISETKVNDTWVTYTSNFSGEINPVLDNETVYVRIYFYNTYNNFMIQTGTNTTNVVPSIKGTVSAFDSTKILAINDYVATKKDLGVNINTLNNDVSKTKVTKLTISTPPNASEGVAILNPDNTITFNPALDFLGVSVFSYTISNATETSTATVNITISENTDQNLSLWNGVSGSFNPIVAPYVNSNASITATGASLIGRNYDSSNSFFETGDWSSSATIDLSKYVQFKIAPDANHQLNLNQFNFVYSGGGGKFQVKYSTDATFSTGVKTLISETAYNNNTWITSNNTISQDINPLLSTQTLYIRFYVYNTYNTFKIKNGNENNERPVITGTVKDISTLTANNDDVSTFVNQTLDIPVLFNDVVGTNALQPITFTQPLNGTVVLNGTTALKFTPASSFLGTTSFSYTIFNGTNYSSATVKIIVKELPIVISTWKNAAWDNKPTANSIVEIKENYPPSRTLASDEKINSINKLTIFPGYKFTIGSGESVTIQNDLTVNGTLDILDKGSLIMINDAGIVSGNINYKRKTPSLIETDYTYWSSPVAGQNLKISPDYTYGYFYLYDNSLDNWRQVSSSTTMVAGKGYIIRGQKSDNTQYNITATFIGPPNNGVQNISVAATGKSILLGNPYPSALDANTFLSFNANVLEGTLYFWTHKTAIDVANSSSGKKAGTYTSDDYAAYNSVGGTSVGANSSVVNGILAPSGKIAAGQGFFGTIKAVGTVTFNNAMRLGSGREVLDNGQFFKTKNTKEKSANNTLEKSRIWLNVTNTEGAFKQTLIGYLSDATNTYDDRFDGESRDGNSFIDFYSINEDRNFVIQGRALPFDENDVIPLGFKTTIKGDFSINIDQVDGLLRNQSVFLEDKLTNTTTNLKTGNYTFTTLEGTFNDRFVLKYTHKTLGINAVDKQDGILAFYSNDYKTLIVKNEKEIPINSVSLFTMTGQIISVWDVKKGEQTNIQIPIKNISSGIYVVKVNTTTGESNQKIIIKQ